MAQRRQGRVTLKIQKDVYEQARDLASQAARHGWSSMGVDSDEPATIVAVLEQAVKLLAQRAKARSK